MFVWFHPLVYCCYIERQWYPSYLLVNSSKWYCLGTSLNFLVLFCLFFTSLFVIGLPIATNIVGILWKLVTFMSTPYGVNMDLYEDLKSSST
jgi:hypothetical protein